MKNLSQTEAAYMGALLDGEGYVGFVGTTPVMEIVNMDVELLSACLRATGVGSIGYKKDSGAFRWRLCATNAHALAVQLRVYSMKAQKILKGYCPKPSQQSELPLVGDSDETLYS